MNIGKIIYYYNKYNMSDKLILGTFDIENYVCPITLQYILDPVVASDGHVYEKTSLKQLFGTKSQAVSPMTREIIKCAEVKICKPIKIMLDNYFEQYPEKIENRYHDIFNLKEFKKISSNDDKKNYLLSCNNSLSEKLWKGLIWKYIDVITPSVISDNELKKLINNTTDKLKSSIILKIIYEYDVNMMIYISDKIIDNYMFCRNENLTTKIIKRCRFDKVKYFIETFIIGKSDNLYEADDEYFHNACKYSSYDTIKYLVDCKKIELNNEIVYDDIYQCFPADIAFKYQSLETFKYIVENDCCTNIFSLTLLSLSKFNNYKMLTERYSCNCDKINYIRRKLKDDVEHKIIPLLSCEYIDDTNNNDVDDTNNNDVDDTNNDDINYAHLFIKN